MNYYRLRQVDRSGAFQYSDLVVADSDCEDHAEVDVYPNPTTDRIFVKLTDFEDTEIISEIILNDALGRTLQTITVPQSSNSTTGIDLTEYDRGLYFIRIKRGKLVYRTHKVMKW